MLYISAPKIFNAFSKIHVKSYASYIVSIFLILHLDIPGLNTSAADSPNLLLGESQPAADGSQAWLMRAPLTVSASGDTG